MQPKLPLPPAELLEYIRRGDDFLIIGHKEPDGDCAGSQLALASALRRMGKRAESCSSGPFKKSEIVKYQDLFLSTPNENRNFSVILVDCGSLGRTGDIALKLKEFPLAIIDHHESDKEPPPGTPVYQVPESPSTTLLIYKLFSALGLTATLEEAELLLFGLCTDTGFFRHVDHSGSETFAIAAELIGLGANPQKIYRDIHGGKNLLSRVFMGRILASAEAYYDGALIIASEEYADHQRFGLENRDSDAVYQQFQSISEVKAIVLIRQETRSSCSVGLRSRDSIDVAEIAKSFGGGGHKNASGISNINGVIEEVKPMIIDAFKKEFSR